MRSGELVQMIQTQNSIPIYIGKYLRPTRETISVCAAFRSETCVAGTMVTVIQVIQVILVIFVPVIPYVLLLETKPVQT